MTRLQEACTVQMGRRQFVQSAGLLAVGAAFGDSLAGCSAYIGMPLPKLPVASPPTPMPGMTYIWASKIGCSLDCDLDTGRNKHTGGAATDDAPCINAAMAGATAANPITLIIDGSALISGLYLPSDGNWSIAGLGGDCGLFIKSGSNSDGIMNASVYARTPMMAGPPVPPRGQNVSLSNFTLNGNRAGDSTSGQLIGNDVTYFCGITLSSLNNISIENLIVANTPAYCFRFSNVGNISVSGCTMLGSEPGSDGLHFDGPANDITISNCYFATGDDSIALNCPEGYSGDISRVSVSDCTFKSWSLMRLYTVLLGQTPYRISSVNVSNCSGTLEESAFLIGLSSGSFPNSVDNLMVTDCTLTAPAVLGLAENFGTITLRNLVYTPSQSGVHWIGVQAIPICAIARKSPLYGGGTFSGSTLILDNCQIVRKSNLDVCVVIMENESQIESIDFNGFAMQDSGSYTSARELLNLEGGTVGTVTIDSLNSKGIQLPVESGGFANINSLQGAGVLATGWEFPDEVMAGGVPYISSTTGKPSIKVDGIPEPYTPS